MTAEPLSVTELDAATQEELRPPCSVPVRGDTGMPCDLPARWIAKVRMDICGHHFIQVLLCDRCLASVRVRAEKWQCGRCLIRDQRPDVTSSEPLR